MSKQELAGAIDEFEDTLRQSAGLESGGLESNRKRGIELRRMLALQSSKISSLGDQTFSARGDHDAFRAEFARMRTAIAFHQASWPMVAVDLNNLEYRASLQKTRDANRHFIAWTRDALGKL